MEADVITHPSLPMVVPVLVPSRWSFQRASLWPRGCMDSFISFQYNKSDQSLHFYYPWLGVSWRAEVDVHGRSVFWLVCRAIGCGCCRVVCLRRVCCVELWMVVMASGIIIVSCSCLQVFFWLSDVIYGRWVVVPVLRGRVCVALGSMCVGVCSTCRAYLA